MVCNSENRLGRNGATEIKAHPFFAGVDFSGLRRIGAPFVPPLTSDVDTSFFPVEELPQTEDFLPADGSGGAAGATIGGTDDALTPEMFLPFIGYTFKRFEKSFV